jgi:citrate lyase beta subunit
MTTRTTPQRARRSVLSVPGTEWHKLEKAAASEADEIMIDLEDAVAPSRKAEARATCTKATAAIDFGQKRISCRVNPVGSAGQFREVADLVASAPRLDALVVPKVTHASQVVFMDTLLRQVEAELDRSSVALDLLVETAAGVRNITALSEASDRIESYLFGAVDYAVTLGTWPLLAEGRNRAAGWEHARAVVATEAAAWDRAAIDGAEVELGSPQMVADAARQARSLGFDGKLCIHPEQVGVVNAVFTPSEEELAAARDVLAAQPGAEGAVAHGGIMIDEAVVELARRVVSRWEAAQGGGG